MARNCRKPEMYDFDGRNYMPEIQGGVLIYGSVGTEKHWTYNSYVDNLRKFIDPTGMAQKNCPDWWNQNSKGSISFLVIIKSMLLFKLKIKKRTLIGCSKWYKSVNRKTSKLSKEMESLFWKYENPLVQLGWNKMKGGPYVFGIWEALDTIIGSSGE